MASPRLPWPSDNTTGRAQPSHRPDSPSLETRNAEIQASNLSPSLLPEGRLRSFSRHRAESSSIAGSFSSLNLKTPTRSYYQKSYHWVNSSHEPPQHGSHEVREDTAALASRALSDVDEGDPTSSDANQEASELASVDDGSIRATSPSLNSTGTSMLTEMIRRSPPTLFEPTTSHDDEFSQPESQFDSVVVAPAIISQPHEGTPLLQKRAGEPAQPSNHLSRDIESLLIFPRHAFLALRARACEAFQRAWFLVKSPETWDRHWIVHNALEKPARYLPAIILGLLLNVLDALSYGMILFPLGQPIFAELGPDGISMFYVSCIVSQLVYSMGGSMFRGGVGSEMIEVVPFFHNMASTIMVNVGEGKPKTVLATTILSYSASSVLTGIVFFIMGNCKLGALIGFFPRHILIGCIGGVGFFLVATGLEVSARLEGNFHYDLNTLKTLVDPSKLPLWLIPLALAWSLFGVKYFVRHSLTDATFFISIIVMFYAVVTAVPELHLETLRTAGWVFEAPAAGVPWYHFYSLYDFGLVDWKALASTIPAMLALTFFGVLHVPINIPAVAFTTGEDNVDVDRELRAHGYSNILSGIFGSIQNYLVYTNTVLFMRSGGNSRVAGALLAAATFGVLLLGPVIIGFIPIMVVGALIFFLGFDLLREALFDTLGKVNRWEYLTIISIVLTMGVYDFVGGILVGIIFACVSFVLQASTVSAIRSGLSGSVASSMVRRHPTQQRFLHVVGNQIHVLKLAGFLFFGTIVGVENTIKSLLAEEAFASRPIRFLAIDLSKVDGVDFSAAEAFARISRLLNVRNVEMIMCGFSTTSSVGKSLYNVGLLEGMDRINYYEGLNSALESCENELLKAFYQQKVLRDRKQVESRSVAIPKVLSPGLPDELSLNSPRGGHLRAAAAATLQEHDSSDQHQRWRKYDQPLKLILQTFSEVSHKDDEFWRRSVPFFERREYLAGKILYYSGDRPEDFFLLESGMLKAIYEHAGLSLTEAIVAGATCGELPFFSETLRSATVLVDRDAIAWVLTACGWTRLQTQEPDVAHELLKVSLTLTSERMNAITKYMLLIGT